MNERGYSSIGQVLDLLKPEFPDLTISKIRFLESQGLLDPERTPSGYRKFYEADLERLRFILRAQHEQYLPLKVIKGRLGVDEGDGPAVFEAAEAERPARAPSEGAARGPRAEVSERVVDRGVRPPARPAKLELVEPSIVDLGSEPVSMTLEEVAELSGLPLAGLTELERFGLIVGRRIAGTAYYDGDCVEIACVAAAFGSFGVEARHLRMYKTAVEREAAFFEQVITPMLKQRNPQARRQAIDTLLELSRLGQAMRAAALRQLLRDYTGG